MEYQILDYPYDESVLREIIAEEPGFEGLGIIETVEWILSNRTKEQMARSIGEAWSCSTKRFREYVSRIENIEVAAIYSDLKLRVTLSTDAGSVSFFQRAPVEPKIVEGIGTTLPFELPLAVRQLCAAVPAYTKEEGDVLIGINELRYPLFTLRQLLGGGNVNTKSDCAKIDNALQNFSVVLAVSETGDYYLLSRDNNIWFADHENGVFVPCKVAVEEFLSVFFEIPHGIINPLRNNWLDQGRQISFPILYEKVESKFDISVMTKQVRSVVEKLPYLAILALSIRVLIRDWPEDGFASADLQTKNYIKHLRKAIEQYIAVTTSGKPLRKTAAKKIVNKVESARDGLDDTSRSNLPFDETNMRLSYSVLSIACSDLANERSIRDVPFQVCLESPSENTPESDFAYNHMKRFSEELIDMNLGEPSTLGKPVPGSFFNGALGFGSID